MPSAAGNQQLPASLTSLNQAAVRAARAGDHTQAVQLYEQLFQRLKDQHLTHPELFVTHSNKAASHIALGQHAAALQASKQCLELLSASATAGGLSSPSRHPHWPKACLRLGQAFAGLGQNHQAAAAFEAGLTADPNNSALRSGLQQAHQGLAADLLSGKTLAHIKALPAPAAPERITLTPHNSTQGLSLRLQGGGGINSDSSGGAGSSKLQRRGHQVGWKGAGDAVDVLLTAAEAVSHALASAAAEAAAGDSAGDSDAAAVVSAGGALQLLPTGAAQSFDAGSWQLPKVLLTPAAAASDVGLQDVYEYLSTQCAIRTPKHYMYRVLPDTTRMSAWWTATTAAVQAVAASGRVPRVLLLGAKAGVLAVAAWRAGARHVTCVESTPHLAAACHQVLLDNGLPPTAFTVIHTPNPTCLKIAQTTNNQPPPSSSPSPSHDVPNVCNCLIADMCDDGVLSGGLLPAVAHALEELLVRDQPVVVPQRLTVMAQAVGVRPSVVEVEVDGDRCGGGDSGSSGGCGKIRLDLTALDRFRWTPTQALPSLLDPSTLIPLSAPVPVWHMPLLHVVADRSAVQQLDVEATAAGSWCAVAFWAELQLFGDITHTTAGPWSNSASSSSSSSSADFSGRQTAAAAEPLLLTYPAWDTPGAGVINSSDCNSFSRSSIDQHPRSASQPHHHHHDHHHQQQQQQRPHFAAPPSQQPALCWLPGALPVAAGDIYPLTASHNTVRCMFVIREADYAFLFAQEPSFPHAHFAMVSDQQRLSAYAAALRAAVKRAPAAAAAAAAAAAKALEQQQQEQQQGCVSGSGAAAAGSNDSGRLTVVDLGCGSGVLSLLAAAALHTPHAQAMLTTTPCTVATQCSASEVGGNSSSTAQAGCVVGIELTGPLSSVAQRVVAANGAAAAAAGGGACGVSIVQADAGSCRRGREVPLEGADVIVLDLFDAGLVGHGVLGLVESAKANLAAAHGAQIVPASATLFCMGIELLTVNSWGEGLSTAQHDTAWQRDDDAGSSGGVGQQDNVGGVETPAGGAGCAAADVDLQALEGFRWCDTPDTALLHQLPHKPLTAPAKLGDFDFCCQPPPTATAGSYSSSSGSSLYPKDMSVQLEVVAGGTLNAVAVWFDLHLAEGVSLTSAPVGFTTGGRACDLQQRGQQQESHHHWGQALHHLDAIAAVEKGHQVQLSAVREGTRLDVSLASAHRNNTSTTAGGAGECAGESTTVAGGSAALRAAPRPPWLRRGAGIEDPAVWSVKKCEQLLGQMLMRAPGAKFPPIHKDMSLMQVHAGSLGLCAATVGAVTQELAMREALAVAGQKQLEVSPFAVPEAAGVQPPVVWR